METQSSLAKSLDNITQLRIQCDNACKRLLGNKQVLARILKYCCREYADSSYDDIMNKYIEGTPLISEVYVNDYEGISSEEINGLNTEQSSDNDGTAIFDVFFTSLDPTKDVPVDMYIHFEAQQEYIPKRLLKRSAYYGARALSRQYGREFSNGHYEDLKKVYGIWICFNPKKADRNTITRYYTAKDNVYGESADYPDYYDMSEIFFICLGEEETDNKLLDMLNVLFSKNMPKEEKKKRLSEEHDFKMTIQFEEEVSTMCDYSNWVLKDGIDIGINKGIDKYRDAMLKHLHSMGMTEDQIKHILAFDPDFTTDSPDLNRSTAAQA